MTLPFELRAPVAYQPGLMRQVASLFADSLLRWYARRLAPTALPAQGVLLTVIQRASGDLRLSPHLHVIALDGLFHGDHSVVERLRVLRTTLGQPS